MAALEIVSATDAEPTFRGSVLLWNEKIEDAKKNLPNTF